MEGPLQEQGPEVDEQCCSQSDKNGTGEVSRIDDHALLDGHHASRVPGNRNRSLGLGQKPGMFVQSTAVRQRDVPLTKNDLAVINGSKAIRREVMRSELGHQNEMCVGNAEAMDQHSHPQWLENGHDPTTDALGDHHNALGRAVIQVGEVIDVSLGNNQALTGRSRANTHEGHDVFILVDDTRGGVPRHDLAEDAAHVDQRP